MLHDIFHIFIVSTYLTLYISILGCIPFQEIKHYIDRLSPDDMCQMFPRLTVNDVHWDEDLEATVVTLPDDTRCTRRGSPTDNGGKRLLSLKMN